MKIVEEIRKDKEIQELKEQYKNKFHKNAPPYNYDEYAGIEDYKNKLKERLKHPEYLNDPPKMVHRSTKNKG